MMHWQHRAALIGWIKQPLIDELGCHLESRFVTGYRQVEGIIGQDASVTKLIKIR